MQRFRPLRIHSLLVLAALAASSAVAQEWNVVIDGVPATAQPVAVESLRYGTKTGTKPGVTELVFTRAVSPSTPIMLGRLQSQQPFGRAIFTLTRGALSAPLQVVTLSEVTVTAVQLTATATSQTETIFLRFNRLERVTNIISATGSVSSTQLNWNVATGAVE